VLNHVSGTIKGITAVYVKYQRLAERAAALEAWGRQVETLIGRGDNKVVALRRR
jgi:hypothetical protein